jgi:transposase-like protein
MVILNAQIVCPKCHSENLKLISTPESRDKDWCHFSCAECGYHLTFADVGRQAVAQSVKMMGGREEI